MDVLPGPVREHPAPSGALRQEHVLPHGGRDDVVVTEHPAPSGALRLHIGEQVLGKVAGSGSTQHH
ncbi:hypothetical protein HMPREF1550_00265 [Actinomyces sp. oral taxon 877 str. F0543]|nr:hypothetical protein HMPREF1550_00265 [Actinomyces sp. oral taxon 877 str. F0543]